MPPIEDQDTSRAETQPHNPRFQPTQTLSASSTRTNFDLAKFVFKSNKASKRKISSVNCKDDCGSPHRKVRHHPQTKKWEISFPILTEKP
jgi:hypothetical protein